MIGENHLIRAGGIGSFYKGFARLCVQQGWRLTCVLDRMPQSDAAKQMHRLVSTADYVWPVAPLGYPQADRFAKFDIVDPQVENFKASLSMALAKHDEPPALIIVNTPEAIEAPVALDFPAETQVIFYTHHENLIDRAIPKSNRFSDAFNAYLWGIARRKGVRLATQSAHNLYKLRRSDGPAPLNCSSTPLMLPMPIPDEELLNTARAIDREGVLFIGRFEPRKSPDLFVAKVAETGLPAKVLTNEAGKRKFMKAFAAANIVNYSIGANLSGQAKADFIKSATIAFHPSARESYGFCAMETLAAGLPTLCLEHRDWWRNFASDDVETTSTRDAAEKLLHLYANGKSSRTDWEAREAQTAAIWKSFVEGGQYPGVSDSPDLNDHASFVVEVGQRQEPQDYSLSPAFENTAMYLPAVSRAFVSNTDGDDQVLWNSNPKRNGDLNVQIKKHGLRFTDRGNPLFYYPWCLYSAGQAAQTVAMASKNNWLTLTKSQPGVAVLGDSGGYQVQEGSMHFGPGTAIQVLSWLERVATHAMTFDFPTGGISRNTIISHLEGLEKQGIDVRAAAAEAGFSTGFMACLLQSKINLDVFQTHRVAGKTKLLNVVQGRNEAESKFWYDEVKGYDLDGWAFAGIHHSQLSMTMNRLIDMYEDGLLKRAEWIHFLGISTIRAGVSLTFIQRALKKSNLVPDAFQITFDSSSPTQNAVLGYQAVIGWESSDSRWTFKPERIGLTEYVDSSETIYDIARRWQSRRPDTRNVPHTLISKVVPLRDLITSKDGARPSQTGTQSAMLMHHNTQAYIEGFRSAYMQLTPKHAASRPPQLRYLDMVIETVTAELAKNNPERARQMVTEGRNDLDTFMGS